MWSNSPLYSGVLVIVAAFSGPALAQEAAPKVDRGPDTWKYDLAFYFWLADLEGDLTIRDITAEADAEFSDILDSLEAAATFHFEAWESDSVGAMFDLNWMSLEQEPEFPGGEGKIEFAMTQFEALMAARSRRGIAHFDVFGGLRWVRFDTGLETPGGLDEGKTRDYFDPVVGVRIGCDVTKWLELTMRFDVAGFGVGTEMSGNFVLTAEFQVSQSLDIIGGWRSMGMEVDEDRYDLDLRLRGPIMAVNFGF